MEHKRQHGKYPIYITYQGNAYQDAVDDKDALTLLDLAPITVEDLPAIEQYADYCHQTNIPFNAKVCAAHINEHRLALHDRKTTMTNTINPIH